MKRVFKREFLFRLHNNACAPQEPYQWKCQTIETGEGSCIAKTWGDDVFNSRSAGCFPSDLISDDKWTTNDSGRKNFCGQLNESDCKGKDNYGIRWSLDVNNYFKNSTTIVLGGDMYPDTRHGNYFFAPIPHYGLWRDLLLKKQHPSFLSTSCRLDGGYKIKCNNIIPGNDWITLTFSPVCSRSNAYIGTKCKDVNIASHCNNYTEGKCKWTPRVSSHAVCINESWSQVATSNCNTDTKPSC